MTTDNDATLVRRAQGGDAAAFGCLIERHFRMVFTVAYARLGNREAAEDLSQEVFLQLFLRIQMLRDGALFPNWAARAARNLATDWGRRNQTRSRLVTLVPEAEAGEISAREKDAREQMADAQTGRTLLQALDNLDPDSREAILLHCVNGLSKREIAARLGVHPTSVGRRIDRALGQMREMMTSLASAPPAALMPQAKAVQKSVAIAGATAALSSSARAALLASPPASESAVVFTAASKSLSSGTLKSLAAKAAGGLIMGKAKLAAAGAIAAIIAGWWLYRKPDPKSLQTPPTYIYQRKGVSKDSLGPPADPMVGAYIDIQETTQDTPGSPKGSFLVAAGYITKRDLDDRITTVGVSKLIVWRGENGKTPIKNSDGEKFDVSAVVPKDWTANPIVVRLERDSQTSTTTANDPNEMSGAEFHIQQLPGSPAKYNVTISELAKSPTDSSLAARNVTSELIESSPITGARVTIQFNSALWDISVTGPARPDNFSMAIHYARK